MAFFGTLDPHLRLYLVIGQGFLLFEHVVFSWEDEGLADSGHSDVSNVILVPDFVVQTLSDRRRCT